MLFTPWGEGLVRSWYRRAMVELSHLPHVRRVAIQTNLSCRPGWLAEADLDTLALWVTYHPGQVARERFLARCRDLAARGVRFSVGVVGLPEHLGHARRLRADLPDGGLPLGQRRGGRRLHRRRGGRVDGDRPAVPVQPDTAPQRRVCPAAPATA